MKIITIVKTNNENNYYFDYIRKQWLLFSPFFLKVIKSKFETQSSLRNVKTNTRNPTKKKHKYLTKNLIKYYNDKISYLLSHNYFSNSDKNIEFIKELTANDINYYLANTPQLLFEVTEKCNLSCKYCGYGELYHKGIDRSNRTLNFEDARALIEYLSSLWNSDFYQSSNRGIEIGFYGGEPLVNMSFIKRVVEFCVNTPLKEDYFKFNMTTNGVLLDKYIDFLVKYNFNINISLDGDFENNGYRITKEGYNSFSKVFKNVKLVQNNYSSFFNAHVQFFSVLHNKNSAKEIHSFFTKNFQKMPVIMPLNNSGILENKKDEFWQLYRNYNQSVLESGDPTLIDQDIFTGSPKIGDISFFIHSEIGYNYNNYFNLLTDQYLLRKIPTGTCMPFAKKIYLTTQGDILPCERIDHIFTLGRVENGIVNLDFHEIAKKYNGYYKKLKSQCQGCYTHSSCKQCLFVIPNINLSDPVCRSFKNMQAYKNYLDEMTNEVEINNKTFVRIKNEIFIS
jgi:uncharacterized protein